MGGHVTVTLCYCVPPVLLPLQLSVTMPPPLTYRCSHFITDKLGPVAKLVPPKPAPTRYKKDVVVKQVRALYVWNPALYVWNPAVR